MANFFSFYYFIDGRLDNAKIRANLLNFLIYNVVVNQVVLAPPAWKHSAKKASPAG